MKEGFKIAFSIFMLLTVATPAWALEPVGPGSEIMLQILRIQEGREPTAEELVEALNRTTDGFILTVQYAQAEISAREALTLGERDLGQKHPKTLTALSNLAVVYQSQGHYGKAEPLLVRALETCERILGKDHLDTFTSINDLAELYRVQGRYDEAEPLYLRSFKGRERVLGKDHPGTLMSANNLAVLYQDQGRYSKAEPLLVRTLKTSEQVLRKDHPNTLTTINNLAVVYESQGRYGEAEPLYVRTLESNERVLGKDHLDTLVSVDNLAGLYVRQGRYDEAEELYQRALKTREQILGEDHPDTLFGINNLAFLYQAQGRYDKAESLYMRTLEISKRSLDKHHPLTLHSLNNLAVLYGTQGHYDKAAPWYRRALEAHEQALGKDHPKTLTCINNLGWLYYAQGRYDKAEPLYRRALEGRVRMLGENHLETLGTRINLAVVLINREHWDRALQELRRVDRHLRRFVGAQLTTTHSERVRRRWLVARSRFQYAVFSLALRHPESDAQRLAADVVLRWKRLAEESEALITGFIRTSKNPKIKDTAAQLAEHRAALSRLVNLGKLNNSDEAAAYTKAIARALKDIGRLEVELARLSREYRDYRASRDVDWEQVRSGLPKGSALLTLRAFQRINFVTGDSKEPHWLALVIPADPGVGPEIILKDLGPIAPIERERKTLRETGSKESARRLYRRLFGKLDAELARYERLYVASDGTLDLVPFARLILPDGRYWIERQALHRIQTGRDLVAQGSDTTPAAGMVAYGGVDYAACPPGFSSKPKQTRAPSVMNRAMGEDRVMLAMNQRLRGEGGCFKPLVFSGREAKDIGLYYWDIDNRKAEVWRNQNASETRLKALASPPRILHLATHGFFLARKAGTRERPLTLSGLALAGANDGLLGKLSASGEDGILYALEVQGLNLEGTELVTLSACDTGRGEVDYSEGVYGLVRAFRIAGARYVLMSLWKLNDLLAADFMRDFYTKWLADPGRHHPAKILRETQLAWIRDKDPEHREPKYWAPYVLIEGR